MTNLELCKQEIIDKKSKSGLTFKEFYIEKNFPNLYYEIINFNLNKDLTFFKQKIYNYYYQISEIPKCKCGTELKLHPNEFRYRDYCSVKCAGSQKKDNPNFKLAETYCKNNNLQITNFGQIMYHYNNQLDNIPICTDKDCSNIVNFQNGDYNKFCSPACQHKNYDPQSTVKAQDTCEKLHGYRCFFDDPERNKKAILDKFGVDNVSKLDFIKEQKKKTCLQNTGYDNPFNIPENREKCNIAIRKEETQIKKRKTVKELYGEEVISKVQSIKDKAKKTCNERYDADNYVQSEEYKILRKQKHINTLQNKTTEVKILDVDNDIIKIKCIKCGKISEVTISYFYSRFGLNKVCPECYPINKQYSFTEKEIYDFLKSYDLNLISPDKTILKPKHIDIFIPEYNLGIEYNGFPFHDERYKLSNYHQMKTFGCIDKNIQLLHIYHDDWKYKNEIIKSIILSKLDIYKETFLSKNCKIRHVKNKYKKLFLKENHLKGSCKTKINLGLYYNDELVYIMCFKESKDKIKLVRFCNKLNTQVIDGAIKLFNYYLKKHYKKEIISYADLSISNGEIYKLLGFKLDKITKPNYYYIIKDLRKNKKVKDLEKYSETDMYKIYNSGYLKFIYKKLNI